MNAYTNRAPADILDLIASHGRWLQSENSAARMGKQLRLDHMDFGAIKLQKKLLRQSHFMSCGFSCADLRESEFISADLSNCDLSAADLTKANFTKANLSGADLSRAVLIQTDFSEAHLGPHASEHGARHTKLSGAVMQGTSFARAQLVDTNFDKAKLEAADFSFAKLQNVSFKGADLRGVQFALADLGEGMAEAIAAAGGQLAKSFEPGVLEEIIAQHALWVATDGGKGIRAGLRGAHLVNARLVDVDLSGADLSLANLVGADLTGARLICTDLRGANLSRARMTGADFRGALLDGAHGFMPAGSL